MLPVSNLLLQHQWEYVRRKSRPSKMADGERFLVLPDFFELLLNVIAAVFVVAHVVMPDGSVIIPIVMQYRPPIGALVVEFPAGLVEGRGRRDRGGVRIEGVARRNWSEQEGKSDGHSSEHAHE